MAIASKLLQVLIKTSLSAPAKAVEVAAGAGDKGAQVVIRAQGDAKYQLQDLSKQGLGPDVIKAKRLGQNLLVTFEDGIEPDLVIEGYYSQTVDAAEGLIGQVSDGGMHHYLVENHELFVNLGQLAEGTQAVNAVLSQSQILGLVVPPVGASNLAGAAVNTLGAGTLGAAPLTALGVLGSATVTEMQNDGNVASNLNPETGTGETDAAKEQAQREVAALVQAAAAAGQDLSLAQTDFDKAEQALAAAVAALGATATPAQLAAVEAAQAALTAAAAALATAVTNAQTAVDAANAAAAAAKETAPDFASLNAAMAAASTDVQGASATIAASEAATDGKVAALVQAAAAAGQDLSLAQTDFDQAEQALAAAVAALGATATPAQLAAVEVAQAALTAAAAALATAVTNAQTAVDAANAAAAAAKETAPDMASLNAAIGAASSDVQGASVTTAASEAATDGQVAALVQTAAAAGQTLGLAQTDFDQAEQALAAAVAALGATATPAQLAAVEVAQAALTAAAAALATAVTNAQTAVDAANAAAVAAKETAPDLASLNAAIGAATTDVQGAPATTAASEAATDGQVAARLKAATDAAISLGDAQAVCDAAEVTLANALTQLSEPATAEQLAAVEAAQNDLTAAAAALDTAANNAQQAVKAAMDAAAAANETAPNLASVGAAIDTAKADVLAAPATTAASEAITDAHVKTWADNAQSAATAANESAAAANEAAADLAQAVAALGKPATAEQMAAVESLQTALAAAAAVAATKAAEAAALAQGASAAATAAAETVPASVAAATSAAALAHTAATQNVAPTLLAVTLPEDLAELLDASAQKMGVISGTLSVTDLDLNSADGISQLSAATSAATLTWSAGATLPAGVNVAALVASGALSFTGTPASDGKTSSITWTYDPAAVNLDWMHKADTLTIEYPITVSDGTQTSNAGKLVIKINGSWDTATLSGDFVNAINEDVVTAVGGQLSVADLDAGHATFKAPAADALKGTYGNFSFDAETGEWTYTLDNSLSEVQALFEGQTVTNTLMVGSFDGSDWQDLVVTITGKNDTAAITGTATGDVTEDSAIEASGKLSVSDVDKDEAVFQAPASLTGNYGTFTFDETTGDWGYALDSTNAFVQALPEGIKFTDTLNVLSKDGTASQSIEVTITGTNDTAAISGTATGVATEDSAIEASGKLSVSDVDKDEAVFQVPASLAGIYGTFTFDKTTGTWGYTLDNGLDAVQALADQQVVTDSLTLTSLDGSATEKVVVNITGRNDAPVNTLPYELLAFEDTPLHIADLSVHDVDGNLANTQLSVEHGTLTVDVSAGAKITAGDNATGSLTLSGTRAEINAALATLIYQGASDYNGDEVLHVLSTDSAGVPLSAVDAVPFSVLPVDDAPVISGNIVGEVTEANGSVSTSGQLIVQDIDSADVPAFVVETYVGNFGELSVDALGAWTYTTTYELNPWNGNDHQPDSFNVFLEDGSQQEVTITIHGSDDPSTTTGDVSAELWESDTGITLSGAVTNNDWDSPVGLESQTTQGKYGLFTLVALTSDAQADWTYTLDAAHENLAAGEQLVDTFMVLASDGNQQPVTITIKGQNDGPVLSVTSQVSYASGSAAKAISAGITLADVDSATMASATVSITTGFVPGEDVLSLNNVGNADIGNIVASYVAATGELNMTSAGGTATQAQWQAALRAVAYSNALVIPTVGERTVSYAINDGLDTSAPLTSTINVKAGPEQTVSFSSMTKDSGVAGSNVDWLTNDGSAGRLVSGTLSAPLEANQTLKVYADGVEIVNAVVSGTNWQVTDTAGYSADWTYTAYVADANGRTGPEASRVVTNDVTAEAAPVITAVTDSATSAIANSGTTTNALSNVSGTGVTGNTIYLYDNTVTNLVGTATVVNGAWTVSVAGLSNVLGGSNAFAAVQMDAAGNTSVMSNVWTVNAGANLVPNGDFDNYSGFTSGLPQQTTIDWFNSGFQISGPFSSTQERNPQPLTRTGGALVSTAGGSSISWAVDSYQYIVPNSTIYWDTVAVLLGKDSRMYATAHSNSGLVTVYQSGTFQVEAGKTYQFGLNYGTNDWATQGLIVIVDGVSMALTTPIGLGETNGITGALTATYTAAQTKSISIKITGNNTGNGGIGGDIYLDDISFKLATTPADGSLVAGEHMGGTPAVDNLSYGGGLVNAQGDDDVITVTGTDLQSRLLAGGLIQGGEGYDTLVLAAGTSLDMNALRAVQTVESLQQLEAITLQGNSNLTLNANDVLSLGGEVVGGKVRLVINKTSTDQVTLENLDLNPGHEGTWASSGSAKIGADSYEVLNHSTTQAQVLLRVPDPVFGSSSATAVVAENTPAGTVVHDATADADVGMTYSLVAGADAALFSIDEETGEVRFKASPDFETPQDVGANNVYNFTVRAANNAGGTADQAVAITVTDGVDIGQATVNLGVGFGTLSAPKDIDGRTYYYWNSASGNGGWDRGYNNFVEGLFNEDVNGNVKPAGIEGPNDIYRYATINGVRLALPTAGIQTDENGYVQGVVNGNMRNAGTAVNSGATYNSKYSDMLAVWDAYNGTETDIVNAATAHPSTANNVRYYWTATPVSVTGTPNGQHVMVDFLSGDAVGRADNLEYNVMVQVLSPQAGLAMPVITLASGQGKLINPVEVEGKWYYSWDRSGEGVLTGYNYDDDYFSGDQLNTLFNKDIFGNTNTVGADMNEVFRYTTLKDANGADVRMAVPTYGGMVNASGYANIVDWQNTQTNFGANTSVNAYGTINTVYDDFAAIADAGGVPPLGWTNTYYKTSSVYMVNGAVRTEQHLSYLNGDFYTLTDSGSQYGAFALEMVKPNLAPVLADTALSFGTASANSLPVGAVGVLVSDLMGGVTDGDAGAPKGVAIIDIQYGGTLWYSTNGGTNWLMSKDLTAQKALLLGADADNRIFFQPGKNMTGTVNDAITFRAWDRSRGEEGQFLGNNTTVNGGASPFSAATETLSVNVGTSPIVLDLNGDGSLSYSHVAMDVNGDGRLDHTAWAGAQDGVLVWDKNGDGLVRDASQYAFTQYGSKTDLQGLAAGFDSNGDGVFDATDAKFAEFAVWQDANQNGVSDAGEVRSLADVGVASIDLSSDGVQRSPADGVNEAGRTTAINTDGSSMLVADAAFEFSALSYRVSAEGDLSLLGEQMSLDLSSLVSAHGALHSVDLSGTGANSLKISLSDLLSLGEQQPLRVLGDADDSVELDAAQWTASGSAQAEGHSYAVYAASNGQQLWLEQHIHMA